MGLDMNVFRIRKIDEEEIKRGRYENTTVHCYPNTMYISERDIRQEPAMYADILPMLQKVNLITSHYDYDLIKIDHAIPADTTLACFSSLGHGGVGLVFGKDLDVFKVQLETHDLKKYTKYAVTPYYIAEYDEEEYWRKDYDLQDKLYALYQDFYDKTKRILQDIRYWNKVHSAQYHWESVGGKDTMTLKEVREILRLQRLYGLDYLKNKPSGIENCGYHLLSEKMAKAAGVEYAANAEEMMVYHEWY